MAGPSWDFLDTSDSHSHYYVDSGDATELRLRVRKSPVGEKRRDFAGHETGEKGRSDAAQHADLAV